VQFHPESILTPVGKDLLANFIGIRNPLSAPVEELAVVGY
jgi:hypothetical protein